MRTWEGRDSRGRVVLKAPGCVDETGLQRELRRHGSLSCYSLLEPLELSRWHASSKYLAMRRRYAPGEA